MALKISLVLGSVREGRMGIRMARYLEQAVKARGHIAHLIDPLEYDLPLLKKRFSDYAPGTAPPALTKLSKLFMDSDAVVLVSAEYNHMPPPALLNLMDHFLPEYNGKASAIACYSMGPFGGMRAAMSLRAFVGNLGMPSIPTILTAPIIQDAFDESGKPKDAAGWTKRTDSFLGELERYATALKGMREKK